MKTSPTFSEKLSQEKIVYREKDRIPIEKEKVQRFELLILGSTNRRLEPVLLTLKQGQETPKEKPHQGEEFGFVLRGRVTPRFGKEILKIKKGECFYLSAEKEHWLQNTSFVFGVGTQIDVGRSGAITFDARYDFGLTARSETSDATNASFYFTVGYRTDLSIFSGGH